MSLHFTPPFSILLRKISADFIAETTPKGKGGKLKRKTSVKAAEESDEDREAPKKTVKGRGKKKAAEPVVESPSEGEKADINE